MQTVNEHTRHKRAGLIPGWASNALAEACLVIAGVGGIGSNAAVQLAMLGACRRQAGGWMVIVDNDDLEDHNRAVSMPFALSALPNGTPKVEVVSQAVRAIDPDVHVIAVRGDATRELGLGLIHRSHAVLNGMDTVRGRLLLSRICKLVGTPFVDVGVHHFDCGTTWYAPDGDCYECSLSALDRKNMSTRNSCSVRRKDAEHDHPTGGQAAPMTMQAANFQVMRLARELMRESLVLAYPQCPKALPALRYSALTNELSTGEGFANPVCTSCARNSAASRPLSLPRLASCNTPDELFAALQQNNCPAPTTIHLPGPFITQGRCPRCSKIKAINAAERTLATMDVACDACSKDAPVFLDLVRAEDVAPGSPLCKLSLKSLGFPPLSIIHVETLDGPKYVEVTGDVFELLDVHEQEG